ncbi:DUF4358 domain-containing protein [Paenibacillus sp. D2_2]|uniref:DUF4358 domain-containing protein n=1 Tax=Paenibacillus sp. D2_2 TaxID=3073092 RepID=UPI0035C1E8B3
MTIRSDELIVLKAVGKKNVNAFKEALEAEGENQEKLWVSYLPDQYEKVKNRIINRSVHMSYSSSRIMRRRLRRPSRILL